LLPVRCSYHRPSFCVSERVTRQVQGQGQGQGHPNADLVQDPKHLGHKFAVFVRNYVRFIQGEKAAKSLTLMIMTEKG